MFELYVELPFDVWVLYPTNDAFCAALIDVFSTISDACGAEQPARTRAVAPTTAPSAVKRLIFNFPPVQSGANDSTIPSVPRAY
jgi:hypothetical protein